MLTFNRAQLLHEIADLAYTEGELMDDVRAKRITQDITEGNNLTHTERAIELALGKVRKILYPLTARDDDGAARNDIPKRGREGYEIVLQGDTLDGTRLDHLEERVHNYVVWYALWQWLQMTNAAAAEKWGMRVGEAEDELREMRFGGGFVRRRLYPF